MRRRRCNAHAFAPLSTSRALTVSREAPPVRSVQLRCRAGREEDAHGEGEKEGETEEERSIFFFPSFWMCFFLSFVFFLFKKINSKTSLSLFPLFSPRSYNHEITQHPTETFERWSCCSSSLNPLPAPSLLTHEDRPPTDTGGGGRLVGETSAAGVLAAHDLPRKGLTWIDEGWRLGSPLLGEGDSEEDSGRQLWRSAGVVPVFVAGEGLEATLKKARSSALVSSPFAAPAPADAASFSPTAGSGVDQQGVRGRAEEEEEAARGSEGAETAAEAAAAGAEEEALLARSGVLSAAASASSLSSPSAGGEVEEGGGASGAAAALPPSSSPPSCSSSSFARRRAFSCCSSSSFLAERSLASSASTAAQGSSSAARAGCCCCCAGVVAVVSSSFFASCFSGAAAAAAPLLVPLSLFPPVASADTTAAVAAEAFDEEPTAAAGAGAASSSFFSSRGLRPAGEGERRAASSSAAAAAALAEASAAAIRALTDVLFAAAAEAAVAEPVPERDRPVELWCCEERG